jgi:deoxyxylulose-5-phosphate synthase
LTIALHYVHPNDLLIWDVGHQAMDIKSYRSEENFHTNRQLGGISGFPKALRYFGVGLLNFYFGSSEWQLLLI